MLSTHVSGGGVDSVLLEDAEDSDLDDGHQQVESEVTEERGGPIEERRDSGHELQLPGVSHALLERERDEAHALYDERQ